MPRMSKLVFFDTETDGLPKNYKAPVTDTHNWPRIMQLGWVVADKETRTVISSHDHLIIPPDGGFAKPTSPEGHIHGFTDEMCRERGNHLRDVLSMFFIDVLDADMVIAHNMGFDRAIVGAECIRTGMSPKPSAGFFCTMLATVDYCALPGPYGYKWPKLQELYRKLFNEEFDGAHGAIQDATATMRCYFELKRLNIL